MRRIWQLPPRRKPVVVVDNRWGLPREPGNPGRFFNFDEGATRPGQIPNDGDSPGLPSGISLDPSRAGGTGIDFSSLDIDKGGVIKIIVGPAPLVATFPDLAVPPTVFAWEVIAVRATVSTPVNGIDIPQLTFDDGPFAATVAGNVFFQEEIGSNVIGVGNVNLPMVWAQGYGSRPQAFTNAHPISGSVPTNNRVLSGHHIRITQTGAPAANGWQFSGLVVLVREWLNPR